MTEKAKYKQHSKSEIETQSNQQNWQQKMLTPFLHRDCRIISQNFNSFLQSSPGPTSSFFYLSRSSLLFPYMSLSGSLELVRKTVPAVGSFCNLQRKFSRLLIRRQKIIYWNCLFETNDPLKVYGSLVMCPDCVSASILKCEEELDKNDLFWNFAINSS